MFNPDFYPTPDQTIYDMLSGFDVSGKIILEPSAGKGNIIDILQLEGAKEVLACEVNEDLRSILNTKCKLIENDFLDLTSDKISHIDAVIMNPPFSADEKHILHAYDIAPAGCEIISLCNIQTLENAYSASRKRLVTLIQSEGNFIDLGDCFSNSERKTGVYVGLIRIKKPGDSYKTEFEGFFLEEEPEQQQENGIMSYDLIRDIVNRYVQAVKIYDKQLDTAIEMNNITKSFYSSSLATSIHADNKPIKREDFKKDLQKSAWNFIFNKMNMGKYMTRGVKDDINKFVEQQTHIPFTMKNIYVMLEGIISTTEQRIDKALLEVFDRATSHHHDNRHNLEGWKTNSHYLLNQKFIFPNMAAVDKWNKDSVTLCNTYGGYFDFMEDFLKALCFITGDDYNSMPSLANFCSSDIQYYNGDKLVGCHRSRSYDDPQKKLLEKYPDLRIERGQPEYGKLFDWTYFTVKAYKKGTMHFTFKDADLWARFNQRIAKIKGYPLYENVKKEQKPKEKKQSPPKKANVLFEISI